MSSSDGEPRTGQAVCLDGLDGDALLAVVQDAVRRLEGGAVAGAVSDAALLDSVTRLHRVETMVHAEKLRRVAEVDDRRAYCGKAVSTADLLASCWD